MKSKLVHQNLDTSFVNLSALVKYLRRRQFLGTVKVQLNGYQAEIQIKNGNHLKVSEHDRISGRVSKGQEAFQRLLIRSREPGGSINVYQQVIAPKTESLPHSSKPANTQAPKPPEQEIVEARPLPEPSNIAVLNGHSNGNGSKNGFNKNNSPAIDPQPVKLEYPDTEPDNSDRQPPLPDFPFNLTNKVESKAKRIRMPSGDWQTLLKLTVELLGVVDKTLANHRLDFTAAFKKACTEISEDYTFMSRSAGIFKYSKGRISMTKQVNETIFVGSICEALGKIVEKLGQSPKFAMLHRDVSKLIIALINKRKKDYDKFGITRPLEKILGR